MCLHQSGLSNIPSVHCHACMWKGLREVGQTKTPWRFRTTRCSTATTSMPSYPSTRKARQTGNRRLRPRRRRILQASAAMGTPLLTAKLRVWKRRHPGRQSSVAGQAVATLRPAPALGRIIAPRTNLIKSAMEIGWQRRRGVVSKCYASYFPPEHFGTTLQRSLRSGPKTAAFWQCHRT